MAKKSRRVRRPQPRLSQAQMVRPMGEAAGFSVAEPPLPASSPSAAVVSPSAPVDLGGEYRYVIADLKRIGVLAVAMLAVLIVLAFLLT